LKQNCERGPFKPTGKITLALQPPIKFGPQWHMLGIYPDGQDTSLAPLADLVAFAEQRIVGEAAIHEE
jgi:hypothetical protein